MQHLGLNKIDVEVLPWNQVGCLFWESCGFKKLSISMRYEKSSIDPDLSE